MSCNKLWLTNFLYLCTIQSDSYIFELFFMLFMKSMLWSGYQNMRQISKCIDTR